MFLFSSTLLPKFSKADADAYPEYEAMLEQLVGFINLLIDEIPPNTSESLLSGSAKQVCLHISVRSFQSSSSCPTYSGARKAYHLV